MKTVKIKLSIIVEREVPKDWDEELIDFHFTDKGGENYLPDIIEIDRKEGLEKSDSVDIEILEATDQLEKVKFIKDGDYADAPDKIL